MTLVVKLKSKPIIIEIIVYLFILLFMYTALSKLFLFDVYYRDLQRSPFLRPLAPVLAFLVPFAEILISVLLFFTGTRIKGLAGALVLMALFTFYVGYVITTQDSFPCTCGGLIRELTWRQHFWFNLFWVFLAAWGLWLGHCNRLDNDGPERSSGYEFIN